MRYLERWRTRTFSLSLSLLVLLAGLAPISAQKSDQPDQPVVGPAQTVEQSIEALFGPDETEKKPEESEEPKAAESNEPVLYISDTDNGRIVLMQGITGDGYSSLGLPGYGYGRFLRPAQIWVDHKQRVYVADSGNNRIVRMDKESAVGWTEYGGLHAPSGVAVSRKGVYIADTEANRIVMVDNIDEDGKVLETITHDQMTRPTNLWLDSDDALYICAGEDPPGGKVFKTWMDKDRRRWKIYEGEALSGSRFRPTSVVTIGRTVKLLDGSGNRVVNLQDLDPARLKEQNFRSERQFRLSRPQGLAVDESGKKFYIADSGNDRILEVNASGEVVGEFFGHRGDPNSMLRNPTSIFVFNPAPEPEPEPEDDKKKKKKK